MKRRLISILAFLSLIVFIPILLRKTSETTRPDRAQDRLVIITPHNESIRQEFGEAFAKHWKQKTGRTLYVDWRTPGGTSEIRMVLDSGFAAAKNVGKEGIGIDIFFGGGEPDFSGQARKGRFLPLDVFEDQPKLFGEKAAIPPVFTGERYYAADHTWVATCLSQFGICYNPEALRRLKLSPPTEWRDLADPRYAGQLALSDPTKSGSVARTFELIIQSEMLREIERSGESAESLSKGWAKGFQLIQQLSANARYFTDSASKIPHDVSMGDAAAGMCIDFYGRSYGKLTSRDGTPRLIWTAPRGGTTLSADPIAILRGAPNLHIAQAFVNFTLSREGQALWFSKPGVSKGTIRHALHRLPIRRDLYAPEFLAHATIPQADPYHDSANFVYRRELTGASFNTIRQLVKIMCIDSHEEMKASWKILCENDMPQDALRKFLDVSVIPYRPGGLGDPVLDGYDALETAQYAATLGESFRQNYRAAAALISRP